MPSDYEMYWAEMGCNEQELMWSMQELAADDNDADDNDKD